METNYHTLYEDKNIKYCVNELGVIVLMNKKTHKLIRALTRKRFDEIVEELKRGKKE